MRVSGMVRRGRRTLVAVLAALVLATFAAGPAAASTTEPEVDAVVPVGVCYMLYVNNIPFWGNFGNGNRICVFDTGKHLGAGHQNSGTPRFGVGAWVALP